MRKIQERKAPHSRTPLTVRMTDAELLIINRLIGPMGGFGSVADVLRAGVHALDEQALRALAAVEVS